MGIKEMFGRVREKFNGDEGQVSPLLEGSSSLP